MKKWFLLSLVIVFMPDIAHAQEHNCPENQVWNNGKCINRSGSCNHYTENCGYTIDENGNVSVYPSNPNGVDVTLNAYGFFYQNSIKINNLILDKKVTTIADGAFLVKGSSIHGLNKIFCEKGSAICNGSQVYANTPTFQYEIDPNDDDKVVVYSQDGSQIVSVYADFEDLNSDNVVSSYNKKDENGNVLAEYDGRGNIQKSYDYTSDGSVYTYDANHKLIGAKKTSPFTPAEAAALVKKGNNNKVKLTFK